VIEHVLARMPRIKLTGMPDLLSADAEARRIAREEAAKLAATAAAAS